MHISIVGLLGRLHGARLREHSSGAKALCAAANRCRISRSTPSAGSETTDKTEIAVHKIIVEHTSINPEQGGAPLGKLGMRVLGGHDELER